MASTSGYARSPQLGLSSQSLARRPSHDPRGTTRLPGVAHANQSPRLSSRRVIGVSIFPRWTRSVRGLAGLAFCFLVALGWLALRRTADPALQKAREAALAAEHALRDPAARYVPAPTTSARRFALPKLHELKKWNPLARSAAQTALPARSEAARTVTPASHTFHPNGLLLTNMGARHPITVLIEKAEADWKALQARQSKTLRAAAAEYRNRYHKNPPKGFEKWFVGI